MKRFAFIAALLPLSALAQAADNAVVPPPASPAMSLFPLALILIVFYVLLIRPQQKRQKALAEMQVGLKRGDEVLTAGGILGKFLRDADNGIAVVEIASGVEVRLLKSTLANAVPAATADAGTPKKKVKADTIVKNDNVVPDKESVANDN